MATGSSREAGADAGMRPLTAPAQVDPLRIEGLSNWFDSFLKHFMKEALRAGGEVIVSESGSRVRGVFLHDPVERTASIFTRSPALADEFFRLREHVTVYAEMPLGKARENLDIFEIDLGPAEAARRYSHPIRAVEPGDEGAILALMTAIHGRFNGGWLRPSRRDSEKGYLAEVDGRPVGVAWVAIVGDHGRFHSLSVDPRFRRLGIGSDLWHARAQWARRSGVRTIISEIPEHNVASQEIALRGGMRRVGLAFQSVRP